MTELEVLRRRRELVVLSAELQRVTVVRRLERVGRHPVHRVLGYAKSAASLWMVFRERWSRRRPRAAFARSTTGESLADAASRLRCRPL